MGVTLRYTRDQLIALRDVRASTSDVTVLCVGGAAAVPAGS